MRILLAIVLMLASGAASYWYGMRYERARLQPVADEPVDEVLEVSETVSEPQKQPYREHTVAAGETLYSIGKQYELQWSTIADYNELQENSVIKPGSVIKIPLNEKGEVTRIIKVPAPSAEDSEHRTQAMQQGVDTWYSDPLIVVKRTAPDDYFLKNDDTYTIRNLDYTLGTAMIEVIHDNRVMVFSVAQSAPGKGNLWYITTVETQ